MANLSQYALLLILWSLWTVPVSFSGPTQHPSTSSPPLSFEADLLRIDGDRYVIKDITGVERQVHVGKDTEIFGQVKAGDRIQLWVSPDGHTQTIIIVRNRTQ
jgi:hypothetical protein